MQVDQSTWDKFLQAQPAAHFLQTSAWGKVKADSSWSAVWILHDNCGAQLLLRHLPLGFTIGYIPRGPVGKPTTAFWQEIIQVCKKHHSIFLKVEPDLWQDGSTKGYEYIQQVGIKVNSVQPVQTVVIDLESADETGLLAAMKQKTRYNIHLAEKKEIAISDWDNLERFSEMMQITSARDGFGVHSGGYYLRVYQEFVHTGQARLMQASYQGTPLAAVLVVKSGLRAWYLYGASTDLERNRMPAYLLQWQAICWAKSQGCTTYDLWGIPDAPVDELEAQFTERSDGLWGVYRFKRGFGGEVKRSIGAWDIVLFAPLYKLYGWYLRRRRMTDAG
jgi:peptidoglycan pentaglycine glycine transferase (the first glycine)